MVGSHSYVVDWWVGIIARRLPAIDIKHLHFLLSRELRALGPTYLVTTKVDRPSGPIFNAFWEMGVNANECFSRLPVDVTILVSNNKVFLVTEEGVKILYE